MSRYNLTLSVIIRAIVLSTLTLVQPTAVLAAVGEAAPELRVEEISGRVISLDDYRGKSSLVLIFYRSYG